MLSTMQGIPMINHDVMIHHDVMPCHATSCYATPHHAMPHYAMPHHAMPHHAMPYLAMPHHILACHTTLRHVMPHHIMPCHATPCSWNCQSSWNQHEQQNVDSLFKLGRYNRVFIEIWAQIPIWAPMLKRRAVGSFFLRKFSRRAHKDPQKFFFHKNK